VKVKDLIARLQKCDSELEVLTEGCDCNGDTSFVIVIDDHGGQTVVMICRSDEVYASDSRYKRVEP
jgi:hypothetical protein